MISDMDIVKTITPERTMSVLIRITPEMHAQLTKIAEKMGGGTGVATVMRQIVQKVLDEEGIQVVGPRKGARSNGRAANTEV
jgi:hypothetical protein